MDDRRYRKMQEDDRCTAIYHLVLPHEGFEESAQTLWRLVRRAQEARPGKMRKLFLDIEGHRNSDGGFDADMLELQSGFITGVLARFLCEFHCPIASVKNPRPQDDDIPPDLIIEDRREQGP